MIRRLIGKSLIGEMSTWRISICKIEIGKTSSRKASISKTSIRKTSMAAAFGAWCPAAVFAAAAAAAGPDALARADAADDMTVEDIAASHRAPLADWAAAQTADVVFLGERHDNEVHHAGQAAAVRSLNQARGVAALVFEMIPEAQEKAALAARGWPGRASAAASRAVGPAVAWAASGWPDFDLYAPILEAAPEAYVAGGGYPRRALMAAAVSADWLSKEPGADRYGLDRALPGAQQAAREAAQIASHCNAIPAEAAPMMVDAQRARDGALARAVVRARAAAADAGRSGAVVVITGSGHARTDYGAPALLSVGAPDLSVVTLAFIEAETLADAVSRAEAAEGGVRFDAVAATPPPAVDRGDPCAAFKKKE